MPTSYHGYVSDVVESVRRLQPTTILEIGVGFGKWGHLFREYLDVMSGRVFKDDWKVTIDGVEIFAPYITEHQTDIYSNIIIGDIVDVIDTVGHYDLIFTSDVLEHIEKEKAVELVAKIREKSNTFIAAIPMGDVWLNSQGSMYGNDAEAHISSWADADLKPYKTKTVYQCNKKPINVYEL
jgi:2-polyprenyl-3-methyl-5-hydroxy-6-metoxy-1,4-benzoquinol methylase